MARPRKLTVELAARIQERARSGVSYATMAREFGVAEGTIGLALRAAPGELPIKASEVRRRRAAAAQGQAVPAPSPPAAPEPPREPPPPAAEPADLELVPLLERQVRALEELANSAQLDANVDAYTKIARVLNTTTALLAKIIPPPVPDPEAAPSMLVAAAAARAKIRERLARLGERT